MPTSVRFLEGFENREAGGRQNLSFPASTPSWPAGRLGGYAAATTLSSTGTYQATAVIPEVVTGAVVIASGAFKIDKTTATANNWLMRITNAANDSDAVQIILITGASLLIRPNGGGDSTISPVSVEPGVWNRLDLVSNISVAGGHVRAFLNGVLVCEKTGANTHPANSGVLITGGKVSWNFGALSRNDRPNIHWDDVYVATATEDVANAVPLGDVRVETLIPSGDGSFSQFVGSDGNSVNNSLLVDEIPASAVDYVTSQAVGNRDSYAFTDLSVSAGIVHAVQAHYQALKTDAGAATLKPLRKEGATVAVDAGLGVGTVAGYAASQVWSTSADGTPWTVSKVNGTEFGYEAG